MLAGIGAALLLSLMALASSLGKIGLPERDANEYAAARPWGATLETYTAATQPATAESADRAGNAAAKRAKGSRPYVVVGPDGVFCAKSVPVDEASDGDVKGTTKVFRVRKDADELVDTYDWHAPREGQPGLVLAWSPIAGKIAVLRLHDEAAPSAEDRTELSFYIGGKHLKSYTSKELVALGASPVGGKRLDGDERRSPLDYKVLGCEQVASTNDYRFAVQFAGKKILFDILTGNIAPWSAGPVADAALKKAVDYLAQNNVDTSGHDMSTPEAIQKFVVGNQSGWRISWRLKNFTGKGGQLIVTVWDSGKIEHGYGE
jgi:hypothetical protein